MYISVEVYAKNNRKWNLLEAIKVYIDARWEGLGDDFSFIERALDFAKVYTDHKLVIHDPRPGTLSYCWRTGNFYGYPSIKKWRHRGKWLNN